MYCTECGKEIKENWKVCPACGCKINNTENSKKEKKGSDFNKTVKKRKFFVPIAVVFVFLLVGILISGNPISDIKDAYLLRYSETETIGDVFDAFFIDGSWSSYESGDKEIVLFNGFVFNNNSEKIKVSIEMSDHEDMVLFESVSLYNMKTGQTTYLNDAELESLLNAIYSNGTFTWSWY